MKRFALIIFIFLPFGLLHAQFNTWFIGGKILNWPNTWTDSPGLWYPEGYAILYDFNGSVLLYLNNNHLIAADGLETPNTTNVSFGGPLLIDESSTQSTLFVPHPFNPNIYYLFSTPADMNGNTYYSKIDLSLNFGQGDVVLTEKNVLLFNGGTEKIATAWNASQAGIWVLLHETGNNIFRAYLIDSTGLNVNSYVSTSIGSVVDTSVVPDARGEMSFSFSGTQVACALESGSVEIFDFNLTTGILSSPRILNDSDLYAPYGVTFSPMEDFLYTSDRNTGAVLQFNLDLPDSLIVSSKVILFNPVPPMVNQHIGGCLEPDPNLMKIYQARYLKSRLGVINYPDSSGISCAYDTSFVIGNNIANAGISGLGLPNTIPPVLFSTGDLIEPTALEQCQNGLVELVKPHNFLADSIIWYLNYPSTDTAFIRFTYGDTLIFEYPDTGTYIVHAENHYNSNIFTDWGYVDIMMTPELGLGNDTTLCLGNSLEINLSSVSTFYYYDTAVYHWQYTTPTGLVDVYNSIFTISEEGSYLVEVYSPFNYLNCPVSDSIFVSYSIDTLDLGPDLILPQISNYPVPAPIGYNSYTWSTGNTTSSININYPGTYWLNVINQDGCLEQDTINLLQMSGPLTITPSSGSILCNGNCDATASINISGGMPPYSIVWSTGDTSVTSIDSLCAGDYYVTISSNISVPVCPWSVQSNVISQQSILPSIDFSYVDSTCVGDTIAAFVTDSAGAEICIGITGIFDQQGLMTQMFFYKDDPATPIQDGALGGEIISFKLYRYGDGSIIEPLNFWVGWSTDQCFPYFGNISGSTFVIFNNYPSPSTLYPVQVVEHFDINSPSAITLSEIHSGIHCYGDSTYVLFHASGGTPPYVIPNNNFLVAGTYCYVAEDSFGCLDSLTFTLGQPNELNLTTSYSPIICNGDSTYVTFTVTGGTPPFYFPNNENYSAGTYTNLIARDLYNCADTTTLVIDEPGIITIDTIIGPANSAISSDGYIDLIVSGGIPPYQYLWSTGSQSEDLIGVPTGNYWVELYDSAGCLITDSFFVPYLQLIGPNENGILTIHPNPASSLLFIDKLEPNSTIEIYNLLGELLLSKKNNGTETNIDLTNLNPGNYILKISNQQALISKWFEIVR